MTESTVDERLERARGAVARCAWSEAYELLAALDRETALSPDDLADLARASHWTGRMNECLATWERAYLLYLDGGDRRGAGIAALDLVRWYRHKLQPAVAAGWLRRAERLLGNDHDSAEYGYLLYRRAADALGAGDVDAATALTAEAQELGERFGDPDLQMLAQHERGLALVARGDVDEGFALIDEAAAAAVGGELGPLPTAIVYCNTISACRDVADYGRAGDWTDAAKRWCERQTINGFPGMCRVYRAEVMRLRGDWVAAREDAQLACDELRDWSPRTASEAFYELGEIRLRTGDLEGAEQAFRQAHELGREPVPGLALLLHARGETARAAAVLERSLSEERDRFARARLLPVKVELALALGRVGEAAEAAAELREIAERYDSTTLGAAAATAEGAVALAAGDVEGAIRTLRAALQAWRAADMPYEAGRARILLAKAYREGGDARGAELELDSARVTFERLGAEPDLRAVSALRSADAGQATRRTFLFTDMGDSTTIAGALGDEAWTAVVAWHDRTLRELFAAHGGEEVDHTGDGFFVAFDTPREALACAVAIQQRLATHRQASGFAPPVRIGVHEADARRVDGNYRGRGVHEAARIAALAKTGEIYASAATASAADVRHGAPSTVELKGVAEPVQIVTVDWR
ncbi:MAG: hypothetical protein ICV59_06335 [Thermoleophilia bacterium]|nr:hypothetical protein [Thermoleophilia bacterium]